MTTNPDARRTITINNFKLLHIYLSSILKEYSQNAKY